MTDLQPLVSVLGTGFEETFENVGPRSASGRAARLRFLADLANALAASPLWAEMPRAALVVRPEPEPLLGVVGRFDAAGRARLEGLRWHLENVLPRLRYVGYEQAEEDCELLARRLEERFGREELRSFRFTAIPRGGFIVLGMLAYVLGLPQMQLEPPHPPDRPLVVVDDCALSGVRFGRYLERLENRRVVFAHLYSPPELRRAIEDGERREVVCVSARDLQDHAPGRLGDEYPAWRRRWMDRMDERGYWVGQPDHVCFAWNEPDVGIWNPVSGREESGWRLLPPELCLKNRPSRTPIPVQVQPAGAGPLRPSPGVLYGELEGRILLGHLESGESFVLEDVAADMWRALVKHGSVDGASGALAPEYEVDGLALRRDLRDFAQDLLESGLLVSDD
ncbi:MAG: PqqD family protein [Actinomycetota bacterium]